MLTDIGKKAGLKVALGSRIIRRSCVTALWEENDDPIWHQTIAQQCGHSLNTAARYYDYSDKVVHGAAVQDVLRRIEEE